MENRYLSKSVNNCLSPFAKVFPGFSTKISQHGPTRNGSQRRCHYKSLSRVMAL